ncbi:MAG: sulfatase [Nocardioides sp.]|nr:sulfatase [Nocardioides sp.]
MLRRTRTLTAATATAVVLGTLALVPSPGTADTRTFADPTGPRGGHAIESVKVDNTGPRVGVVVRHRSADWRGRVTIKIDAVGGPRADYTAAANHAHRPRRTFVRAGGAAWRCGSRTFDTRPDRRVTRLSMNRACMGGAPKMKVTVIVRSPGKRRDVARTPIVTRTVRTAPVPQDPPNVVMFMLDDMRADDLRYMPNTRRLIAAQGVSFANAFAPYPLCCPARASVMTGTYTHNHGVYSHLPPYGFTRFDDSSTFATWLRTAGYRTAYLGKYLNGYGRQPAPGAEAGTTSTQYVPPGWTDWHASIDGGLPASHPDNGGTYRYNNTTLNNNGRGYISLKGRYQTRAYGDLATNKIAQMAASPKPFLYYVSFTAPHHGKPNNPDDPAPVTRDDGTTTRVVTPSVPANARGRFDSIITEAPGAYWLDPDPSDRPEEMRTVPPLNEAEKAALLEATRQRAESVGIVDDQVGRVMASLEATGELEQTYVLLTSDNGYFLGEHGIRQGKVLPYEPSLRVPLVMRGPGIPQGQVRHDPVLSTDLAPTFAEIAGVSPTSPVDGISVLDLARTGDRGWTRPVLVVTGPRSTVRDTDEAGAPVTPDDPGAIDQRFLLGVRTARYLYTDRASGHEELFDLRTDPSQYDNVIDEDVPVPDDPRRMTYAEVSDLLRQQLARVRACKEDACNAPLPPELVEAPPVWPPMRSLLPR